jgi:hypothetical protein
MSNVYKKVLKMSAKLRAEREDNTLWEDFKAWRQDKSAQVRQLQRELQRSLQHKQQLGLA